MIRTALSNPYLVIVAALAVTVLGAYSYTKIPADLLPQFETSAVQIVCFYPGMPPEVMEKDIMSRLQRWTGQSVGIEHQEAKAMQGVCVVKDFFVEGVSMDTAMSQVTAYAMSDMFYLPPGTIPPMTMPFDPTANVPLCLVVVSNPQMNETELYDIAYYELRNKLQSIQGVIAPAVYGGKLRRVLAYVDREKLEAHGLSLMDVQRALLRQNVLIPAGSIKIGQQELQIFTNANVEHWEELNYTPIKIVPGQAPVLMKDVGYVNGKANQIQSNIVRVNGSRKAYIPIYRQPGANTIAIVKQIREQLRNIETKLKVERSEDPKMPTLTLSVAMDQSVGVEKSNQSLQIAATLGAVLAGLVVLLFLRSIRYTLVIVLAIPLAILAAIFGMFFTGDTINAMTLGGLALAIGILVDQSIVVLENVVRHAQMGKSAKQAALDGTTEVALPMLVATVTFVVVFFPVVFLSGLAKFLFTPLAIAASIAIFASYLLAITLVPAYCSRFLKISDDPTHEESTGFLAAAYQKFLSGLLYARWLVVLGAAAAFVIALLCMTNLMGRELFPQIDSGQVQLFVRMPTGTRIEVTEQRIAEIEQDIIAMIGEPDPGYTVGKEEHPDSDLILLVSNTGVLMDWPAAYTPNTGAMDTFMLVQIKGKESIFDYVTRLRAQLNEKYRDVEFSFDTGGMLTAALNMGEPSPIHFQIQSSNLETAQQVARSIVSVAQRTAGAADVRIAQRIDYPVLNVKMNRELAARQGIYADDVMKNLVAATNSTVGFDPSFWVDKNKGNHYFFGVQYWEKDLNSIETLKNIPIGSDASGPRRLSNVAEIFHEVGPAVVNHRNITRVTDVYLNVLPGFDVGSVVTKIEAGLEALGAKPATDERGALYKIGYITPKEIAAGEMTAEQLEKFPLANAKPFKGITFRMMGEVQSMRESITQFTGGLIIAAVLVYLVMVAQFRSFSDPLIVLLTVPLGFIGVVAMLMATGTHLNIMAFMGIIMMVGIVVEYSIVLVEFANQRVREGLPVREAILDAAKVRLRPILMTSLTTWIAMLPMAFPGILAIFGFTGGESNAPLARAIIGGVLGATVLSLLVVPCLYLIFKRDSQTGVAREWAAEGPITGATIMNRSTATNCLAVLAVLAATGCQRPATSVVAPGGGEHSAEQPQVEVVQVRRRDFQQVAEVPASIQANEMARLMSKLDGYVSEVLVDIGDRVRKGQPLARLSAPELLADVDRKKAMVNQATQDAANYKSQIALAAAAVKQEQETLNLRNTEYDNIKTLVDRGSLNRQKLDEAEFAKKSAQAAVERTSAEVAANQAAHAAALAHIAVAESDQSMAVTMSDYLTITAPFDGLITARNVDPGAFVEPATSGNGTPLFEIMQVDQLRVVLYVPMQQAGRLDVGDHVALEKIEAHPGQRIESVSGQPLAITRISKSYDSASRMMRAEIDLDNLALKNEMQFELRPGDYGLARVILHRYDQVLTVPMTAIGTNKDASGESNFVMRVDSSDTCYEERVTVIMQHGGDAAIASDDVSTNDRVVVKDLDRVKHKQSLAGRIKTVSKDGDE